MKYMGSKRWQLQNGLGRQLRKVVCPGDSFVDLFAGSGSVSWFVATQLDASVTAVDLQNYAAALSGSVIERTRRVDADRLIKSWIEPVRLVETLMQAAIEQERESRTGSLSRSAVERARSIAAGQSQPLVRAYGGHYFSLEQSSQIQRLRDTLPTRKPDARVCLAALISAASRCSASPGHTAQPFQPTEKALPHIQSIWNRDLLDEVESALRSIACQQATRRGRALVGDANSYAEMLKGGEVVFVDPPYSAAQYSRFYHVLEGIAVGGFSAVSGAGRSPALTDRCRSEFSTVSGARTAFADLLSTLGRKRARVIVTFPQSRASNGVSGKEVAELAREWFDVDTLVSSASFSTLGGNGEGRSARHRTNEMIITMFPK
ncbi:DNA adenine methylase [Arachnia propionica]|uniref:DNA adenine methylase n=1 Tax=Arachnia propionica TaxID=1750 RepID=UPI003C6EE5E4